MGAVTTDELLVVFAARYAMGRATAGAATVRDEVVRLARLPAPDGLTPGIRSVLVADVERWLADVSADWWPVPPIGFEGEQAAWVGVLAVLRER